MTSIDALINRQLLIWESQQKALSEKVEVNKTLPKIITVSRQCGSRGSYFASRLADKFGFQRLHREVIDTICASEGFQKRIIESIDNRFRSDLELMVESIFSGRSVDHTDYFRTLCRVVLSMSKLGGVILVGRGGSFILGKKRGFHIRVVADKEKRIENLVDYKFISREEAEEQMAHADSSRSLYVKKLFNADIDDSKNYDLVINSSCIDVEDMLGFTKLAVEAKFNKLLHLDREED